MYPPPHFVSAPAPLIQFHFARYKNVSAKEEKCIT
uniref:Uncharacterized protein n=1 Tax=Siphoviridae sp. ct13O11 TaxID=2825303 RepID=A0A8S5UDH1_9CAUD|nr:MAG TPA: hypothetical protein [Siphoviridae sp. ct13O11]